MSTIFGILGGFLTFLIWTVAVMFSGGAGAGKAAAYTLIYGAKYSLIAAVFFGAVGFLLGPKNLIKIFGIVWGTDKEFNEKLNNIDLYIPTWFVVVVAVLTIIISYGYLYKTLQ